MGTSIPTDLTRGTFGSVPPVSTAYRGIAYRVTGVFSGRKYPGLSPPRTTIMDRSLYVTLSPTGGPRGDPQAHETAGSIGRCYDMTPGESRGVNYKTEAAGAAGAGGEGTSQVWTSPLRSDRGGERGSRGWLLLNPGLPVWRCRSRATNMALPVPRGQPPCPAAAFGLPWDRRCEAAPREEPVP